MTKKERILKLLSEAHDLMVQLCDEAKDGEFGPSIFSIAAFDDGDEGILFSAIGATPDIATAMANVMRDEPATKYVFKEALMLRDAADRAFIKPKGEC